MAFGGIQPGERSSSEASRGSVVAALILLSLLWAAEVLRSSLLPRLLPDPLPPLQRQGLSFGLFAVVAACMARGFRAKWPSAKHRWIAIWVGIGLFLLPALLIHLSGTWISGFTRTALLTLVPLLCVVFEPYFRTGSAPQLRNGLLATLVAIAGTLFVFPVPVPDSIASGMGFCAVMVAAASVAGANCLAVTTAVSGEESFASILTMAAIAGTTAAVSLSGVSLGMERTLWAWNAVWPQLVWSVLVDLPGLFLLFWLMRRMPAAQMATRYVLAPLLAVLLGTLLMGEHLPLQSWFGLLMMAVGSGYLLLSHAEEDGPSSISLGHGSKENS